MKCNEILPFQMTLSVNCHENGNFTHIHMFETVIYGFQGREFYFYSLVTIFLISDYVRKKSGANNCASKKLYHELHMS